MKFDIYFGAGKKASFRISEDAQQYAQWLSGHHHCVVEVIYTGQRGGGIVGQYKNGLPTPEFAPRSDAWFPAGPKAAGAA